MTVKLVILKSGEEIIADVKEGLYQDKVITYIFDNPHKVIVNGSYKILDEDNESANRVSISLYPWPSLSSDKIVSVVTDWVVTVVEANSNLKKLYEDRVLKNGKQNDQVVNFTEQSNADIGD
jgi:hypothetical protein